MNATEKKEAADLVRKIVAQRNALRYLERKSAELSRQQKELEGMESEAKKLGIKV